jgi:Amt family ammonium transporter
MSSLTEVIDIISGTVALCAGCNCFPSWAAVLVGAVAGPLFKIFEIVLLRLRIDDPLDAIPVHGVGGLWGTLSVYIFKYDGLLMTGSNEALMGLAWNCIGLLVIIAWTSVLSFIMFFTLKKMKMLRVETEHEFKG